MINFIFFLLVFMVFCNFSYAIPSMHPIELYERGAGLINESNLTSDDLTGAQNIFISLIKKYPNSPFGYLGMSQIYRIDAYLGKELYDRDLIEKMALPFALKALELGPSIREVHENYAFFERFLRGDGK